MVLAPWTIRPRRKLAIIDAEDAPAIDAVMVVEAAVFGRRDGVDQLVRHLFERDRKTMLAVERGDEAILRVVDQRGLRPWVEREARGHGVDVLFDVPDRIRAAPAATDSAISKVRIGASGREE